jgi:serine/threonine protein kinase
MAPEIISGDKYDQKVDIFSYGVLIYFILEQRLPWINKNSGTIFKPKQKECKVFSDLIYRCLSLIPEERPSSQEIADTLNAVLAFKAKKFDQVINIIAKVEKQLAESESYNEPIYYKIFETDFIAGSHDFEQIKD